MTKRWPEREILYLALTRPALVWGVPLEAFSINVLGTFSAGAELAGPHWYRCPFLFWALSIPIHLIMRELTALDYHWCNTIRLRVLGALSPEWLDALPQPLRSWEDSYSSV